MQQFLFCLIFFFLTLTHQAQTVKRTVLQDLLDLPAPPATLAEQEIKEYPSAFYDKKNPPPDDAPIEDLLAYWATQNSLNTNSQLQHQTNRDGRAKNFGSVRS